MLEVFPDENTTTFFPSIFANISQVKIPTFIQLPLSFKARGVISKIVESIFLTAHNYPIHLGFEVAEQARKMKQKELDSIAAAKREAENEVAGVDSTPPLNQKL